MKLLSFLAEKFRWKSFSKTLDSVPDQEVEETVENAVVVFFHAEEHDPKEETRVFRHTLKHIKWLAGKRKLKRVVLHSFTHLGAKNAPPDFSQKFMNDLAERLQSTGYEVFMTPFGYFCAWDLHVFGESLAKVWKEI